MWGRHQGISVWCLWVWCFCWGSERHCCCLYLIWVNLNGAAPVIVHIESAGHVTPPACQHCLSSVSVPTASNPAAGWQTWSMAKKEVLSLRLSLLWVSVIWNNSAGGPVLSLNFFCFHIFSTVSSLLPSSFFSSQFSHCACFSSFPLKSLYLFCWISYFSSLPNLPSQWPTHPARARCQSESQPLQSSLLLAGQW